MKRESLIAESTNLSYAWAEAFLRLCQPGLQELRPLVVTVEDIADEKANESQKIRSLLDAHLVPTFGHDCHTVANTIFPSSMWNEKFSRELLYERYERAWPQLKKCPANRRGTYFLRMMSYLPKGYEKPVRQLEHVIETYKKGNHRRSALQAMIFDPTRDHTNTHQLGFPCLHQVGFLPDGDELTVTGYYAMQHVVERAYGNYLGLCRLGRFMAREMGLKFKRMTCVASVAELGSPKKNVRSLAENLESLIKAEYDNENTKSEACAKAAI
jgi:thymidylate synthase